MTALYHVMDELEAESALINFFGSHPARAGAAAAAKLAETLMQKLHYHCAILPYSNRPQEAYQLNDEDGDWLIRACVRYYADPEWAAPPNSDAVDLIRHLSFDVATHVALKAARYLCSQEGLR